jgi:hypothetical protein
VQRTAIALGAVLTVAFGWTPMVGGQEGTPSAGAAACTVEPYDLTEVLEPGPATPAAEATVAPPPVERPTGEPADEAVVAAVTETIEQFVDCYNLGYELRILFLFTPDYLRVFVAENLGPLTEDEIEQLNELAATEKPVGPLAEDEQTVLYGVEEVELLADGRVVATALGDDLATAPAGPSPLYFLFEEVDGRYLIDGVIDPQAGATPAA